MINFLVNFYKNYLNFKAEVTKEIQKQKLIDHPVLFIDVAKHDGQDAFLVFNSLTKKFVCQGTTEAEIKEGIKRVFADKKAVSIIKEDGTLAQVTINGN